MPLPKLKFDEKRIREIAARYGYALFDGELLKLRSVVQERGFLTKTDLYKIASWKAARSAGRVERNSEADVREITRIAFLTTSERARVESLLILDGVGWPMASVILHFYHRDPYPILDYRALWSSSLHATAYDFEFWWSYVQFCRKVAARSDVDMRTLDKALWQYSKESQGGA